MSTEVSVAPVGKASSEAKRIQQAEWSGGAISGLACKCLQNDFTDFLIKDDRIVCACCGREIRCNPPLKGVFTATCGCCISTEIKTTFVLDSSGAYTCTWCGRSR